MSFTQNNVQRRWPCLKLVDSVEIVTILTDQAVNIAVGSIVPTDQVTLLPLNIMEIEDDMLLNYENNSWTSNEHPQLEVSTEQENVPQNNDIVIEDEEVTANKGKIAPEKKNHVESISKDDICQIKIMNLVEDEKENWGNNKTHNEKEKGNEKKAGNETENEKEIESGNKTETEIENKEEIFSVKDLLIPISSNICSLFVDPASSNRQDGITEVRFSKISPSSLKTSNVSRYGILVRDVYITILLTVHMDTMFVLYQTSSNCL